MIVGIGPAAPTSRSAAGPARPPATAPQFVVDGHPAADAPTATSATANVSLSSLLSLQEDTTEHERNEHARRHAADILTELATLQRVLLEQGDTADHAQVLGSLLARLPVVTDPALTAVIRLIALRARVELARHAHAPALGAGPSAAGVPPP
ncbi:MAG: flagellar assembly protein FliX [Acetobacteraceae bacterium]